MADQLKTRTIPLLATTLRHLRRLRDEFAEASRASAMARRPVHSVIIVVFGERPEVSRRWPPERTMAAIAHGFRLSPVHSSRTETIDPHPFESYDPAAPYPGVPITRMIGDADGVPQAVEWRVWPTVGLFSDDAGRLAEYRRLRDELAYLLRDLFDATSAGVPARARAALFPKPILGRRAFGTWRGEEPPQGGAAEVTIHRQSGAILIDSLRGVGFMNDDRVAAANVDFVLHSAAWHAMTHYPIRSTFFIDGSSGLPGSATMAFALDGDYRAANGATHALAVPYAAKTPQTITYATIDATDGGDVDAFLVARRFLDCMLVEVGEADAAPNNAAPGSAASASVNAPLSKERKLARAVEYLAANPGADKAAVELHAGFGERYFSRKENVETWGRLVSHAAIARRHGFAKVGDNNRATGDVDAEVE